MQRGFSLVELAIVLVILGLLTGGILAGQSLIRAAELRGVVSETKKMRTAFLSFRQKYFGLPGDLANATAFWGTDPNGCADKTVNAPKQQPTCDGNGNGEISNYPYSQAERFRSWQHLSNAGLIAGNYTGVSAGGAAAYNQASIGENVPGSRLGDAYWYVLYIGPRTGHAEYFDGSYGNSLFLRSTGGLQPEELWNVDAKIDDGMPATGRIRTTKASGSYSPNCAVGDDADSPYNLSSSNRDCVRLYLLLGM